MDDRDIPHLLRRIAELVRRPLAELPDANRGRTMLLSPGQTCTLLDSKSSSFDQGQAIGIVLDLRLPPNNDSQAAVQNDAYLPLVRARITFGTGQASFCAECDFRLGTQIVVPAETVRVDAIYENGWLSAPGDPPTDPIFKVGASFGYGGRGCCDGATFTVPVYVLPNDFLRIQIPAYAVAFNALAVGQDPQDIVASVFGPGSGGESRVNYAFGSPPVSDTFVPGGGDAPASTTRFRGTPNGSGESSLFPLFNGARYVEIQNPSSTRPITAILVFRLVL